MSDQTNQVILLCPGQGAQELGMGRAWAEHSPAARAVFDEADSVLGLPLSALCAEGPIEQLSRTDIAQPALYTASVASYRGLIEQDRLGPVTAAAGLSLGEFTALHLAGAYDFETGLKLVRLRGQAMQEAAEAAPSGMVALVGADEAQARELCRRSLEGLGDQAVLVPANFNCPGQVVVSGSHDACDRALEVAAEMGLRATALTVAGAFHSPLMAPAARRLEAALAEVSWSPLQARVVSNVTALPHPNDDPQAVSRRLVEQLTSPVRWAESMQWSIANLEGRFVELAPNKVLSGLMRRIDRSQRVSNYSVPPTTTTAEAKA